MTELKTLKDLMPYLGIEGLRREKGFGDAAFVNVDLLRQEAIKWVKFWKNINAGFDLISLKDWMKFFNLIEEDLK